MYTIKKVLLVSLCCAAGAAILLTACQKENSTAQSQTSKQLSVYLTDDPCQYDSVFIDIRYVEVKVDTSEHMNDDDYGDHDDDGDDDHSNHDRFGKWDTLAIHPGLYNVLKLRNGLDSLLGTISLPKSAIRKIRITLGTGSAVVVAGVSHPLHLYPGMGNYVYIRLHKSDMDLDDGFSGLTRLWLDFHICESIVQHNGDYFLKPFFKPFGKHETGSIEGKAGPHDARPLVTAYNNKDTASAIPEDDGRYVIRGLKAGLYSVLFKGNNGYKDSLLLNISVKNKQETMLPLISLKK